MSPNLRRYMPFMLVALLLVFLVPSLLRKKSSGPSTSTRATQTLDAMSLIKTGEVAYLAANGRYTPHLADLLTTKLAADLDVGVAVQIDVGTDGQRYVAQVESDVLSLVHGQNGAKTLTDSCVVVKSGSGVACPTPAK